MRPHSKRGYSGNRSANLVDRYGNLGYREYSESSFRRSKKNLANNTLGRKNIMARHNRNRRFVREGSLTETITHNGVTWTARERDPGFWWVEGVDSEGYHYAQELVPASFGDEAIDHMINVNSPGNYRVLGSKGNAHRANRKTAWQSWSLGSYTDEELAQSKRELEENIQLITEWYDRDVARLETETSPLERRYISEDIEGYKDSVYGDRVHIQQIEEEMRSRGIYTSHRANRRVANVPDWAVDNDGDKLVVGQTYQSPGDLYPQPFVVTEYGTKDLDSGEHDSWEDLKEFLLHEKSPGVIKSSKRANRNRTSRMWQEGGETLMDYEEAVAALSLPSGSRPRIYMDYNDQILGPKSLHYLEQYLETYGEPIRYRTTSDSMDNIADWMIRPASRRANRKTASAMSLDEALQQVADASFYEDKMIIPVDGGFVVENSTRYFDSVMYDIDSGNLIDPGTYENSGVMDRAEYFSTSSHIENYLPNAVDELRDGNTVHFSYQEVMPMADSPYEWGTEEYEVWEFENNMEDPVGWILLADI